MLDTEDVMVRAKRPRLSDGRDARAAQFREWAEARTKQGSKEEEKAEEKAEEAEAAAEILALTAAAAAQ